MIMAQNIKQINTWIICDKLDKFEWLLYFSWFKPRKSLLSYKKLDIEILKKLEAKI